MIIGINMWNIFCDLLVAFIACYGINYFFFDYSTELDTIRGKLNEMHEEILECIKNNNDLVKIERKLTTINSNYVDLRREFNLLKDKNGKS